MKGLTIIVAEPSAIRLRSALTLALAQTALGGTARIFLDSCAVGIVRAPVTDTHDADHAAAGLPTLTELHAEALDAGVGIMLCQTGLALTGAALHDFDPRVTAGGMVSLMQTLGEDRLVVL